MASSKVSPKDLASPVVEALNTIDSVADQITVIDSNTDSIKVTVEDTNAKLDGIDVDIDTVVSQSTVIDENVDNVKITVEDNNSKINEIDTEIDDLNEDIDLLKSTIITLNQELATVKSLATEIEKNVIDSAGSNIDIITADATATEEQILYGEIAYVKGERIIGTMPNNGSVKQTLEANGSYTIPEGYHDGTGTVSQSLATQNTKSYAPSTNDQIIPAGTYLTGDQIIAATTGTAVAENVLIDKTFNSAAGISVKGTMPNRGSVNPEALSAGSEYVIPEGYHDGTGKVSAKDLASQTDGTASKDQILVGQTAYVDGVKITGEMPNIAPSQVGLDVGDRYTIPKGYHDGTGIVVTNSLTSQLPGTASAGEILLGETAWVDGVKITGEMPNNGGVIPEALAADEEYKIPAGYHDGTGKVKAKNLASQTDGTAIAGQILLGETAYVDGVKITGEMPNIGTINQTLVANGTFNIPKGYHDGTGKVTQKLTNQTATTYNPDTKEQTIKAGTYLTGDVKIAATTGTATADEVLVGETFNSDAGIGVTGTMPNNGSIKQTLSAGGEYTIPEGYHDGTGSVTAKDLASQTDGTATAGQILAGETAYVDGVKVIGEMPNNGQLNATLAAGKGKSISPGYYSGGMITAKDLASQTDGTATAGQILAGETAWVDGVQVTGEMPNRGSMSVGGLAAGSSYSIPAGYHDGTGRITAKSLESQTDGTATAGQILAGETAWVDGVQVIGTMPDVGALNPPALSAGGEYPIPAGYHNGSGKIKALSLVAQTSGTAISTDILSGKTAWANGIQITGTMPNLASTSKIKYSSTNATPVVEGETFYLQTNTDNVPRLLIKYSGIASDGNGHGTDYTDGYLPSGTLIGIDQETIANGIGLSANRIAKGKSVMNIVGTYDPGSFEDVFGSATRVRTGEFGGATSTTNNPYTTYKGQLYTCSHNVPNEEPGSIVAIYDISENVMIIPGKYALYHTSADEAMSKDGTWVKVSMATSDQYDIARLSGEDYNNKVFKIIDTVDRHYGFAIDTREDTFVIRTSNSYTNSFIYWIKY